MFSAVTALFMVLHKSTITEPPKAKIMHTKKMHINDIEEQSHPRLFKGLNFLFCVPTTTAKEIFEIRRPNMVRAKAT